MALTPDVSALASGFVEFGGVLFRNNVNAFTPKSYMRVFKNVKAPQALPKLSAPITPKPYSQPFSAGAAANFTDRKLTVYQSNIDVTVDPEQFRNTYLAVVNDSAPVPFYQYIIDQLAQEYLAQLNNNTVWSGSYNASGTTPAAICTGLGTQLAADISGSVFPGGNIITTGAITGSNAVSKVEAVAKAVPAWMREKGFTIYCSYQVFDYYVANYRSTYTFLADITSIGNMPINNMANVRLQPVSWLGTSQRLVATIDGNMCMGTDGESIEVYATPIVNYIQLRMMMPLGFQWADYAALYINDQV